MFSDLRDTNMFSVALKSREIILLSRQFCLIFVDFWQCIRGIMMTKSELLLVLNPYKLCLQKSQSDARSQ